MGCCGSSDGSTTDPLAVNKTSTPSAPKKPDGSVKDAPALEPPPDDQKEDVDVNNNEKDFQVQESAKTDDVVENHSVNAEDNCADEAGQDQCNNDDDGVSQHKQREEPMVAQDNHASANRDEDNAKHHAESDTRLLTKQLVGAVLNRSLSAVAKTVERNQVQGEQDAPAEASLQEPNVASSVARSVLARCLAKRGDDEATVANNAEPVATRPNDQAEGRGLSPLPGSLYNGAVMAGVDDATVDELLDAHRRSIRATLDGAGSPTSSHRSPLFASQRRDRPSSAFSECSSASAATIADEDEVDTMDPDAVFRNGPIRSASRPSSRESRERRDLFLRRPPAPTPGARRPPLSPVPMQQITQARASTLMAEHCRTETTDDGDEASSIASDDLQRFFPVVAEQESENDTMVASDALCHDGVAAVAVAHEKAHAQDRRKTTDLEEDASRTAALQPTLSSPKPNEAKERPFSGSDATTRRPWSRCSNTTESSRPASTHNRLLQKFLQQRTALSTGSDDSSMVEPSIARDMMRAKAPTQAFYLDEASARSKIAAQARNERFAVALSSRECIGDHFSRVIGYLFVRSHFALLVEIHQRLEILMREALEHQCLFELSGIRLALVRPWSRFCCWHRDLKAMEERKASQKKSQVRAQEECRAIEREKDSAAWALQQVKESTLITGSPHRRLDGSGGSPTVRRQLLDALLRTPMDDTSRGNNVRDSFIQRPRKSRKQRLLEDRETEVIVEEQRWRHALDKEEASRWELLVSSCAEIAPDLVNYRYRQSIVARRECRVVAQQLIATKLSRIMQKNADEVGRSTATKPSVEPVTATAAVGTVLLVRQLELLQYDEAIARARIAEHAGHVWKNELGPSEEMMRSIVAVHDKRTACLRSEEDRIAREKKAAIEGRALIERCALGMLWRRRLAAILPIADVAAAVIGDERRTAKQIVQREVIERADLIQFMEATAPGPLPGRARLFTPEPVPTVEGMMREKVLAAEQHARRELTVALWQQCCADADAVPKDRRGLRVRAATKIQAAYRTFSVRLQMKGSVGDMLYLQQNRLIQCRMAIRAVVHQET